ncbi:hypothetical protein KPHES18084_12240 [Corynebacterium ulcerans]|nr:hypothetical protein CULTSU28_13300 [Corynebacterium ulcerans]STC74314.1 Uncharacterised protein [Corynebacterium ulcerans]
MMGVEIVHPYHGVSGNLGKITLVDALLSAAFSIISSES